MGELSKSCETDTRFHWRRVIFTRRFVFPLSTVWNAALWKKLADDAAAESHGDRMRTRARLELCEQVTHMRFDRFLRQEQLLSDLAIHESVGNELQYLDLARRRLLLELAKRVLERDHVGTSGTATPRRNFLEAARMRQITAEDLLALRSVHGPSIGRLDKPL